MSWRSCTPTAFCVGRPPAPEPALTDPAARDEPVVRLLELVAVHRIVEKVREVREEIEVVADPVRADLRAHVLASALPLDRPAVAVGVAAVGLVDCAKPVDASRRDRARRNLIGRIPGPAVSHAGHGEPIQRVTPAETDHTVELAEIVGVQPRPVIPLHLHSREQGAAADRDDAAASARPKPSSPPPIRTSGRVRLLV